MFDRIVYVLSISNMLAESLSSIKRSMLEQFSADRNNGFLLVNSILASPPFAPTSLHAVSNQTRDLPDPTNEPANQKHQVRTADHPHALSCTSSSSASRYSSSLQEQREREDKVHGARRSYRGCMAQSLQACFVSQAFLWFRIPICNSLHIYHDADLL